MPTIFGGGSAPQPGETLAAVAAYLGETRLIDNITL